MYQYQNFKSLLGTWVVGLIIALVINSCAGFQASVHSIGDKTYNALRTASRTADELVLTGVMTPGARKEFAGNIMVPALTMLEEAITATLEWKEGEPIPEAVAKLIGHLTKSTDNILKSLGKESNLYNDLIKAKNSANEFLEAVN